MTVAEVNIAADFIEWIDEIGEEVPGGRVPPYMYPSECDFLDSNHLLEDYGPAFALARHHGAASRLLDWTSNPLAAAFFAARGVRDTSGSANISVYALHQAGFSGTSWKRIPVLRSHVGFLHAQAGVLIYRRGAELEYAMKKEWPSLIDEVQSMWLRKITLPYTEVRDLLRLLEAESVDAPHLMPTFDVIKAFVDELIARRIRPSAEHGGQETRGPA